VRREESFPVIPPFAGDQHKLAAEIKLECGEPVELGQNCASAAPLRICEGAIPLDRFSGRLASAGARDWPRAECAREWRPPESELARWSSGAPPTQAFGARDLDCQ